MTARRATLTLDHGMVDGVCAGLGRRDDDDPTLGARPTGSLAVGGFGTATNVVLWILLGDGTSAPWPKGPPSPEATSPWAGTTTFDPAVPDAVVTDTTVGVG